MRRRIPLARLDSHTGPIALFVGRIEKLNRSHQTRGELCLPLLIAGFAGVLRHAQPRIQTVETGERGGSRGHRGAMFPDAGILAVQAGRFARPAKTFAVNESRASC